MSFRERIISIEKRRVGDLKRNVKNPKIHSQNKKEKLEAVLDEFGKADVLISYMHEGEEYLFDGHARQSLNDNEIWYVALTDYTQEEVDKLVPLYDTLSGDIEWDQGILADLLAKADTTNQRIAEMLSDVASEAKLTELALQLASGLILPPPEENGDAEPQISIGEKLAEDWGVEEGQVWMLPSRDGDGYHLLMCGDSTRKEDVSALIGDIKACIMPTDPPYGVNYKGATADELEVLNDSPETLESLLMGFMAVADEVALENGSPIYIAHPAGSLSLTFGNCVLAMGWRFRQTLVWVKDSLVLGHSDYHYKHEPYFLLNSSPQRGVAYEPFSGSGTTLLACENTNRYCRAIELSPNYVAVGLQRYKDAYGITPIVHLEI